MSTDTIEKARIQRNDGDPHPKNPNLVWSSSAAGGKGDWRVKKKTDGGKTPAPAAKKNDDTSNGSNNGGSQNPKQPAKPSDSFAGMSHDELVAYAKQIASPKLVAIVNNTDLDRKARVVAFSELKTRDDFDESQIKVIDIKQTSSQKKNANVVTPKPTKVQYQTKKPKVKIEIPSVIDARDKQNRRVKADMVAYQTKLESLSDDNLFRIISADKMGSPERQHLAYEEAMARGIDESKIKIGDSLQKFWDRKEKEAEATGDVSDDNDNDEFDDISSFDYGLGDFDLDSFKAKFEEGDTSWDNPDNDIVKKTFDLKSPQGRRLYDNVRYALRTENPKYVNPKKQIQRMAKGFLQFTSPSNKRSMLVCYGGAGVGKTYNLKKVLNEFRQLEEYDPKDLSQGDDYDWVVAPQVNSVAKLAKRLNEHNGKIIIFDDNDDILTDSEMSNLMKTLTDGDLKSRFFPEYDEKGKPTGKNIIFTGKIIVLTNKDSATLSRNGDANAVMSRASKMGINFTVQENIDILKDRFMNMDTGVEIDGLEVGSDEEKAYRQHIFDFIMDNRNRIDPQTFTVRKFIELYELGGQEIEAATMSATSASAAELFGDADELEDIWWENLNKAKTDDMNNDDLAFNDPIPESELSPSDRKLLKKLNSKADKSIGKPDVFENKSKKKTKSKKVKKEISKALDIDWGMSVEEAENLLLG